MIRLLNVHSSELEEFHGDEIPAYAIASHRWAEEITYQDYAQGRKQDSPGFVKVQRFCEFVRKRLVLRWLWIDTVCIDKTNNTELAEAINSMFMWYAQAGVCIADIPDIHVDSTRTWNQIYEDLGRSVWFTRGWTLQELVAPKLVVFVNLTFQWVIAHKNGTGLPKDTYRLVFGAELNIFLADVSGIPEKVLKNSSEGKKLSIEERLSWMDGRQTTRIEDRAYCMLGIFGVYLPLVYGERHNAMRRLKTEIRRAAAEEVEEETRRRDEEYAGSRTGSSLPPAPEDEPRSHEQLPP